MISSDKLKARAKTHKRYSQKIISFNTLVWYMTVCAQPKIHFHEFFTLSSWILLWKITSFSRQKHLFYSISILGARLHFTQLITYLFHLIFHCKRNILIIEIKRTRKYCLFLSNFFIVSCSAINYPLFTFCLRNKYWNTRP